MAHTEGWIYITALPSVHSKLLTVNRLLDTAAFKVQATQGGRGDEQRVSGNVRADHHQPQPLPVVSAS